MSKSIPDILFQQLFWTFLTSSIASCLLLTIFFPPFTNNNKWFTPGDVKTLDIIAIAFNLCLTLTSLTTLFNSSVKVRNNKSSLILSYFMLPSIFILLTLAWGFSLKEKDIYPLDFSTLGISYSMVTVTFLVIHIYYYVKFRRRLKT